ncbi:AAA family ATPase [Thiothrix nivea]|uniref:AAA ATPase n=1 Tax=Thiothrix nivea (strain ATCC 35100 / DSM 5205 / JP2) TaxID=870187 RepID=A0A656HKK1_THINJ|nr:AAA family ATPase [Thiothrix nivea]EIJ37017.1 AAA ATPase [Thiothrix nivea DSM 5205]
MQIENLINNAKFTILLGKNGSGKSTLLRKIDSLPQFNTKYISPERGGTLKYDPNVELNISNNEQWLIQDRRKNRTEYFRQQSSAQFRNLEVMVLREIEKDLEKRQNQSYTFDLTISQINNLLPKINIERADRGFQIKNNQGQKLEEDQISSGEAELIALSIEVLVFSRSDQNNKLLLMDEPDVHLHPDLQQRFIEFIEKVAIEFDFKIVIATHSTAILGAFTKDADLQIIPISDKSQIEYSHFRYDPICHEILPVFGAHPLSSHFNKTPVLLVEGEDDKRVFEQVMRSAQGFIKFSPCVVGTVTEMTKWEEWLNKFLPSIYDNPKGYSIRDLDSSATPEINNIGCVIRTRLNCYAIENLLLTKECLTIHGFTESSFIGKANQWIQINQNHQTTPLITFLVNNFSQRRTLKIKDIRNIIIALLGTTKPWEVLVGQLIANNINNRDGDYHSIYTYMGSKVFNELLS